jgi:DMSO reductase anchor subunit
MTASAFILATLVSGSRAHSLIPILQVACCLIFFIAGVSEFRRTDGALQPLDYSSGTDRLARRMVGIAEIVAAGFILSPQYSFPASAFLLALCIGSVLLDPKLLRRSPLLPLVVILLAIVCVANWGRWDSWQVYGAADGLF